MYIEVDDAETVDYWSRVNWYTAAPVGRTRMQMPLVIYVGELSQTIVRRLLLLSAITRLVISESPLARLPRLLVNTTAISLWLLLKVCCEWMYCHR